MKQFSFSKKEKLCSKKEIAGLFKNGNKFTVFPLQVIWKENNDDDTCNRARIMISIPKKKIKKAVVRNRIKRRIKEAYRLNKNLLNSFLAKQDKNISLILIFINKEENNYKELEKKIIVILQRLVQEYKKINPNA